MPIDADAALASVSASVPDLTSAAGLLPTLSSARLHKVGRGRARRGNVAMLYLGDTVVRSAARLDRDGAVALPIGAVTGLAPLARQRDNVVEDYLRKRCLDGGTHSLLCAGGIELIYAALADSTGEYPGVLSTQQIVTDALSSRCLLSVEAVERYCEMVGWAAADTAISASAWGGVYIAGPLGQRLRHLFGQTRFRILFEQRHARAALQDVPTYIVLPA